MEADQGKRGHPEAVTPDDRPTIEDLYRAEHARCVRLAHLLTGDAARAEELAQDAFARLLPRYAATREPAAFLHTVLVNLCRDDGRRRTTVRRHPLRPPADQPAPDLPREVDEVWQAVQRLPERRRIAVVLRYWLDLPSDRIAEALGVRPATVRSLLHRGLADLQEVLHDDR